MRGKSTVQDKQYCRQGWAVTVGLTAVGVTVVGFTTPTCNIRRLVSKSIGENMFYNYDIPCWKFQVWWIPFQVDQSVMGSPGVDDPYSQRSRFWVVNGTKILSERKDEEWTIGSSSLVYKKLVLPEGVGVNLIAPNVPFERRLNSHNGKSVSRSA